MPIKKIAPTTIPIIATVPIPSPELLLVFAFGSKSSL
jgi:hypothetical protein